MTGKICPNVHLYSTVRKHRDEGAIPYWIAIKDAYLSSNLLMTKISLLITKISFCCVMRLNMIIFFCYSVCIFLC